MRPQKIVIVGAGSPTFGASLVADVFECPELRGSALALVDVDVTALNHTAAFARRANDAHDFGLSIEQSADRRDVLPGADFVIVAIGVDTIRMWQTEWEVCQRRGIHHAWCGLTGPAGLLRTLRMVPPILAICHDMEELCPGAWLLNYANPVSRLGWAMARHSRVQAVGLCHGLAITVSRLARILGVAAERLDARVAGINHFSFIVDLRYADTGEDAYPALRESLQAGDPSNQPLSKAVFQTFGFYPVPDDREVSDYLGFCHSVSFGSWERYGLRPYDFAGAGARRVAYWDKVQAVNRGELPLEPMLRPSGEQAMQVARAVFENRRGYFPALNIVNDGCISNLDEDACVEVPGVVSAHGVRGLSVGPLPRALASLCERQLAIQELSVEAAVTGNRSLALQALAIDPVVHDLDAATAALDDLLRLEADVLPLWR